MKLLKNLALLAGVASVAAAFENVDEEFENQTTELEEREHCPDVQILALGGEGTTVGDLGYLDTTVSAVMGAVKNSHLFQIGYPPGADSPTAIAAGVPALQAHIPKFASRCPNSKMFIIGYSAGAAVVGDVLCGDVNTGEGALRDHFKHNIVGIALYGDPTFLRGKSYDRGTCTAADGTVPRQFPGKCAPYGRKMRSWCDENDPECCGGDDTQVHFEYPGLYDGDVASFAKAKVAYWRKHMSQSPSGNGGRPSGSSTSHSTTATSKSVSSSHTASSSSHSASSSSASRGSPKSQSADSPPSLITPFFNIEPPGA